MSRNATYRGVFADGVYDFRLDIGGLEELQELTDAGPEELYIRIIEGRWRLKDLREPIRIGLIRGGMDANGALARVGRYVGEGNLAAAKPLALAILGSALFGAPDEDDKKKSGEPKAGETDPSLAGKSGSRTSTRPAGKSGSRRKPSEPVPSGN